MFVIQTLVLTFAVLTTVTVALERPAEVRYQWKYLNFTWPSAQVYNKAVVNGDYIPKNNAITGIKVWNGQLYLSIPRLRQGVPATLVVTPLRPVNGNRSPHVQPYPNWQMQKIGDCNAFQFVQSMEIDPYGRMWIIDTGREGLFESNKALCPPRLVIIDLENNGKILLNYEFPKDVVNPQTCYLNDITLDHTDGGYAYISNTDTEKPSIVVFSLEQKKSWSVKDKSMYATAPIIKVKNDEEIIAPLNIDSIALSSASGEGQRLVYYAPLSSLQLFSIPTDVLKKNPRDIGSQVKLVGKKPSQTDGMMISANDELYFGLLTDNQVSKWNASEPPFGENQQRVFEDNEGLMWPDTFAIGQCGDLWVTSNKLERVYTNTIDIKKVNFRVIKLVQTDHLSYQYYKDGTAPELSMIDGTSHPKDKNEPIIHGEKCIRFLEG